MPNHPVRSPATARLGVLRPKLAKAKTEEDVKHAWAQALKLDYDTSDDIDLYTPQVLFEFKCDANLSLRPKVAPVLAQLLYYLRRLRQSGSRRAIPPAFALIDRASVVMGHAKDWHALYAETDGWFDWDLPPSKPDARLVVKIASHPALKKLQVFGLQTDAEALAALAALDAAFSDQMSLGFTEKKPITEDNFEDVFAYWNEVFGEAVRNGFKSSRYFVSDIQPGRTQVVASQGKVFFQVGPEDVRIKRILAEDYENFWRQYDKVTDPATVRGIIAKADRLTDDLQRRKHGEFFTPLAFARKGLDYLARELGPRWWERENLRVWDMAAGTGNLQYHLPAQAWPKLYLSTLYAEEVEHGARLFPGATVFQYDYLNDDVGNVFDATAGPAGQQRLPQADRKTWKLPLALRQDLANPAIEWVILINPPFATAQQGGAGGANKADVSKTAVRQEMHAHQLGEVSRELFSQFLFRIRHEFAGRQAWLGLFSKIKYLNATNDQKLRDTVFRFAFRRGFMFSSVNFSGTSRTGQFPVGFLIWDLAKTQALEGQRIELDVFDTEVQKIATKRVVAEHRSGFLSKWITRPPAVTRFPPFSSAITVKTTGPDLRDRISAHFLASLMCKGNDLQNQNMTALLSGPYASAGGHSVTPENFEQALVVHAVRRLPKAQWHNDRDPFLQPAQPLPTAFVRDCVVWSLLANSNATVAMRDVAYKGQNFQIPNHLYPWTLAELRQWPLSDSDMALQLPTAQDRFAAQWLQRVQADGEGLSPQAQHLLAQAQAVYRVFYAHLHQLRVSQYRIEPWDAGWWQVRSALEDRQLGTEELAQCRLAYDALKRELLPQVYSLGFLP